MTGPRSDSAGCSAAGPLAGLKVVELGQLIAGPFAARTLAVPPPCLTVAETNMPLAISRSTTSAS